MATRLVLLAVAAAVAFIVVASSQALAGPPFRVLTEDASALQCRNGSCVRSK